jgi:EpsI family protein
MLGASALAVGLRPSQHMSGVIGIPDLETEFPESFGNWRVDTTLPVILPAPDVQAQLDKIYNQVLARTYVNNEGEHIMLSVAYGGDQSDATSAHRPEVCYPAQGFAITAASRANLQVAGREFEVRRLMSKLGSREEPITYWIVVGQQVVTSGWGQKLAQMRYGLRDIIADGILMRVSSIDRDMAKGYRLQTAFLAELGPAVNADFAQRIFGRV